MRLKSLFKYSFLLFAIILMSTEAAKATDVYLGEEWGYEVHGKTLYVLGGDIYNNSSYRSGSLQIQYWALPRKFNGTSQKGYKMGTYNVRRPIDGGQALLNVSGRVRYYRPPSGRWWVSIILCEWNGSRWVARSWLNYGSRKRF